MSASVAYSNRPTECGNSLQGKQETVYFDDGMRKIDFVLAYDSEKNYRSNLRETFEENLLKAGKVEPCIVMQRLCLTK